MNKNVSMRSENWVEFDDETPKPKEFISSRKEERKGGCEKDGLM